MKSLVLTAYLFVLRDYRVRFRRTLLGVVWFMVPLFTLVSMALFLGKDLGLYPEGQSKRYLLEVLTGLLFWQLLAETWLEPMRLARRTNMLLRSAVFDARVLLGAGAISALGAFMLRFPVLVVALLWLGVPLGPAIACLPLAICLLIAAGASMACFTLPLSLALLDVRYAMPFVQYAMLFATPVLYSAPESGSIAWINQISPFSYLIVPLRDMVMGTLPSAGMGAAVILTLLVVLGLGLSYFQARIRLAVAYIGR